MAIKIVDHGDGTFTASSLDPDDIEFLSLLEQEVEIEGEGVVRLSSILYELSSEVFRLDWDASGDKIYETGLDRGVLYLNDGTAIPWNGLVSVVEKSDKVSSPVYYDGMKISDLVELGDFSATMTAITYPDEFLEFEGLAESKPGVFYADQEPKVFDLSYRTKIGNDVDGLDAGYKIHILYNVTAIPNDKSYNTISDTPSAMLFEWEITAVPEEIPGYRPTAHIIIDSTEVDSLFLASLEEMLYGSYDATASLLPLPELVDFINNWALLRIVDHGDGTWSAIAATDDFITLGPDGYFEIDNANVVYLDPDTYEISDT